MPSRPTLSAASRMMPQPAPRSALSTRECNVLLRVRAVLPIQKTIQVTSPTATIESVPPRVSWASKLMPYGPHVRIAPIPRGTTIAMPTPNHMLRSTSLRPTLTMYATRMPTTRAASRPSRRPIR